MTVTERKQAVTDRKLAAIEDARKLATEQAAEEDRRRQRQGIKKIVVRSRRSRRDAGDADKAVTSWIDCMTDGGK